MTELNLMAVIAVHLLCTLCAFSIAWQSSALPFSALNLVDIRNLLSLFFLISTTDFEKAVSYLFMSNPAFSQAYVLRVQPLFSPVEPDFTAISFRIFIIRFVFCYVPSQKPITMK